MFEVQDVACPYCGETIALPLDASAGPQHCIEDCHVCCRPIEVRLEVNADGAAWLQARAQDEA